MELPTTDDLARRAGRWLGVGISATPIVDLADDAGLIGALAAFDGAVLASLSARTVLGLAFFAAIGVAISRLFVAHRPAGRAWFFAACLVPLGAYVIVSGLRLSVLAALIALAFAFVTWRFAPGVEEPPQVRG